MPRGILATITAKVLQPLSTQSAHEIYSNYFIDSPFVTVLPPGVMPKTASVLGSNKVQMQVAVDDHTSRLIISVAIDNLGKGAAGQAVQNANIMCGYAETDGLNFDGIGA
jgi:N-acetyl-gamma-glutamyl-phosphate reductase